MDRFQGKLNYSLTKKERKYILYENIANKNCFKLKVDPHRNNKFKYFNYSWTKSENKEKAIYNCNNILIVLVGNDLESHDLCLCCYEKEIDFELWLKF
jgi:hypothetical protein